MSALTEALVAAQARAISAVSKVYLASHIDRDEANAELQTVGATDDVDRSALLDALDTIKRCGRETLTASLHQEANDAEMWNAEIAAAIAEQRCNGCGQPRIQWGPICGGMTQGDWTHYHSPEWWQARAHG